LHTEEETAEIEKQKKYTEQISHKLNKWKFRERKNSTLHISHMHSAFTVEFFFALQGHFTEL